MQKIRLATAASACAGPFLLAGPAFAQAAPGGGYPGGPHMLGWGGGYGMIFGTIFMILLLAVVIAVAVLLVRWLGGLGQSDASRPSRPAALDILKERYARGEIDKEEYEERRRVLGE